MRIQAVRNIYKRPLAIEYTVRNEISTLDFDSDRTGSWDDFEYFWNKERVKYNFNMTNESRSKPEQDTFHVSDARRLLCDYFWKEDKFFMWHRTPYDAQGFHAE